MNYNNKNLLSRNNSGKPKTYEYTDTGSQVKVKIYTPSQNESKTYLFKYKISDVVTKYSDIAEFYWQFISSDNETQNENVLITLNIPSGATKDDIKVFAHGPLSGFSEIVDDNTIRFSLDYLPSYQYVEPRILFPTYLISDSYPTEDVEMFDSIMNEELNWGKESDEYRRELEMLPFSETKGLSKPVSIIISLLVILFSLFVPICIVVFTIFVYYKFVKLPKPIIDYDYYRELPQDYSPAVMSKLMNVIGYKDITATILDLVRRKHLKIEEYKRLEAGFFKDTEVESYVISKHEINQEDLKEHEKFFIKWFIDQLGDHDKIDLYMLEKELKESSSKAREFSSDFSEWKKIISEHSKTDYNLFDKSLFSIMSTKKKVATILGCILFMIYPFNIFPLVILIIILNIPRKTIKGNEHYYKWNAFRRYLKDYSLLNEAQVPSLIIWEHYLVYAVSLDIAKEVIEDLKINIPSQDFEDSNLTYLHGYNNIIISGHFSDFEKSISSLQTSVSSHSSSSGSGGGFSSGGGGGGGGSSSGGF